MALKTRKMQEAIKQLDAASRAAAPSVQTDRRGVRLPFPTRMVFAHVIGEGHCVQQFAAIPRNLSTRGVGFVHSQFVHPNVKSQITLPMLNGQWMRVAGKVVNCRHVAGHMHEIGVHLDEPIDLAQFTEVGELHRQRVHDEYEKMRDAIRSEREKMQTLLVVTLDEERAKMWNQTLGDSLGTLYVVTSLEEARAAVQDTSVSGCVIDQLPTPHGASKVVAAVRKANMTVPIIALVEDPQPGNSELITAHGASACVPADTPSEDLIMLVLQQCDVIAMHRDLAL